MLILTMIRIKMLVSMVFSGNDDKDKDVDQDDHDKKVDLNGWLGVTMIRIKILIRMIMIKG